MASPSEVLTHPVWTPVIRGALMSMMAWILVEVHNLSVSQAVTHQALEHLSAAFQERRNHVEREVLAFSARLRGVELNQAHSRPR